MPVRAFEVVLSVPPVSVLRLPGREIPSDRHAYREAHTHDFLVLAYFERGGASIRLGDREWPVEDGDAYVISPDEVVGPWTGASSSHRAAGWNVSFPPEVLGDQAPGAFLSWRAHPLLFPFVGGAAGGATRGSSLVIRALLGPRRGAPRQAGQLPGGRPLAPDAPARGAVRLAADVVGDLRLKDEPLLAGVFGFIEEHYREPISQGGRKGRGPDVGPPHHGREAQDREDSPGVDLRASHG